MPTFIALLPFSSKVCDMHNRLRYAINGEKYGFITIIAIITAIIWPNGVNNYLI